MCPALAISALTAVLEGLLGALSRQWWHGSSHQPGLTPWRTPPRMRPSCHPISRGLAAFHATRSASTARSGWLPRSTTTHTSPCSAAWNRGAGGGQVLGCSNQMTLELNHMPHALVCARHHSDSMRWRSHVESADSGFAAALNNVYRTTRSRLSNPRTLAATH